MILLHRAKLLSYVTSFFLLAPNFLLVAVLIFSPSVSAQSMGSCDVPAVNDPTKGDRISVEPVEDSWWDTVEEPKFDLDTDVFVDFTVDNDSATAIAMRLVPGHMYTFCISISSNQDDPPLDPNSDIYLMTEPNWDRYKLDFAVRDEFGFFEAFDQLPVEWRDMDDWLPFRDAHAYEGVTYQEFSVAIDSSGTGFFGGGDVVYYLVIDGWNNRRHTNTDAAGGDVDVEVLIDVEDRLNIPKFTATLLVGSLPLACIIVPLIIHSRYMSNGKEDDDLEVRREVPYLDNEVGGERD
tara:strand:+ start:92 stop:973 length:882 start_codon:yes stop_codon:yes gene_type:complete